MSREEIGPLIQEFSDKAAELDRKLNATLEEIASAEKEAFERGVAAGLAGREIALEGKTLIIKVPEEYFDLSSSAVRDLQRQFKCKFVICSEHSEIADLHELDLKAIGLKKIEG